MEFRYSPRPNKAGLIEWRPWSQAAFAEAEAADKPVLLAISAVWCHWCHVMDETTYSSEEVIEGLNEDFVPIRVDNDRRPDINARYNMGGWPTAAFLTPDGEVMMGATYVPPRRFREMMDAVSNLWRAKSADIRDEVAAARERAARLTEGPAAQGPVDESLAARGLAPLLAVYDREFGGFGDGAKFPRVDILDAFLARLAVDGGTSAPAGGSAGGDTAESPGARPGGVVAGMLEQTLHAMRDNELWDGVEGGFFRYTTRRDWSVPHFEKMLDDNVRLIDIYAQAAQLLHRPEFLHTAEQAQRYLDDTLWHEQASAYGGSQDADEDYYQLKLAEERARRSPPYVDPMIYTDWNAHAISGLAKLHLATGGRGGYLERAAAIAEVLLGRRTPRGLAPHDPSPDSPDSFLGDQTALIEALVDLYQAGLDRRWRKEAGALWEAAEKAFAREGDPLLADLAREAPAAAEAAQAEARVGRLGRTDAPPQENARLAVTLRRLGLMERDPVMLERATAMLAALAPRLEELRDFGAEIARATLLLLHEPLHVTVVGPEEARPTTDLVQEALHLPATHRLVDLLDPEKDGALLERAGLNGGGAAEKASGGAGRAGAARAYVCVGQRCSAPAATPEELRRAAGAPAGSA